VAVTAASDCGDGTYNRKAFLPPSPTRLDAVIGVEPGNFDGE